jgi:hypothetical protein
VTTDPLKSWNEAPTKTAIVDFVRSIDGDDRSPAMPAEDRAAVFDNDGTLWCELQHTTRRGIHGPADR